jgi:SAM-dependent methyltransferase
VADLPFALPVPLAERLRAVADIEGKIPRVLEELGHLAGSDVGLVDVPGGPLHDRLAAGAASVLDVPAVSPLRIGLPDAALDVVASLWSAFHGVDRTELAEVDRVLRPDGRLLVVHDYGRDDVSALVEPGALVYGAWSRRDGPFLAGGGFRIRVIHCFWTFDTLEGARELLAEAFGERGEAVGAGLKRPRLAWNVAVYHRLRSGVAPATLPAR